jgi:glycosyltransferase involved in cell wall biosynthesis
MLGPAPPHVVFTHVAERDSVGQRDCVRVFRFQMLVPFRITEGLSLDLCLLNRRIFARMREERYDLVHCEAHGTVGIAAKVLAPSDCTRPVLEQKLGRPVALFPRGVDPSVFHPGAREEARRAADRPTALYVGRFSAEKNLGVLVDLFGSRTDIVLQLVGSGSMLNGQK